MFIRCINTIGLLFLCFHLAYAQKILSGKEKINALIEEWKNDADLKHAVFSFCVLNAQSGEQIIEHNSQISLVPASTLKTLTTATAISVLGSGFRYETKLLYTGNFDSVSGILNGNLIIKGSGDPSLNSEYFYGEKDSSDVLDKWVKAILKKGIKTINGKIIADASCFEYQVPGNWIWSDMGNYFGASPNGISFNDNKIRIYFKTGEKSGDSTKVVKISPEIKGLTLINKVKTGGKEDNAYLYGIPGQMERLVKGTLPAKQDNFEVEGSMPDPARFCGESLLDRLKAKGVKCGEDVEVRYERMKDSTTLMYTHKSPGLSKVVFYTNMKSNNHYAESLLRTIALKKSGYGSTAVGADIVLKFWQARGVDVNGLFMDDGSGLSRSNGISTYQQAVILSKIYKDASIYPTFNASLPVAGKSGSLAGLCKGSKAENNLRAKSGYISRARAYCGYVKSNKGVDLSFSLIMNNYTCSPTEAKQKMERLMELLVEL